jgi:hypothetical protein
MDEVPLSSALTIPMKFLFPLVWGGAWSWATAELFMDPPGIKWQGGGLPPVWAKWVFLGILAVSAVMLGKLCLPLKRIVLQGDHLLVSNYRQEIRVSLRQVADVGLVKGWSLNDTPVGYINFSQSTDFGPAVSFYPRSEEAFKLLQSAVGASHGGTASGPGAISMASADE